MLDLEKIKDKKIVVKRKFTELSMYPKWTEVSKFLACGLVGMDVKYKINLKDL